MIALPALVAAKVALYDAMLDRGVSLRDLALRLGVPESEVSRMVDLDSRSRIGQVEEALEALGHRLMVSSQVA